MDDLSNKTMALFLLGAVVVSLFSTMLILGRVSGGYGPTGLATTGTGTVNVTINPTVSITTADSTLVNFGSCTVNESGPIYINSFRTENTTQYCSGGNLPNNISVRNNGNVNATVTIGTSACAPGAGNSSCTFLNVSTTPVYTNNSLFQYLTNNSGNDGYTGGCSQPNTTWISFNGTHNNGYMACPNLSHATTANSFITQFRIRLPAGLSTGAKGVVITYTATAASAQ